ncbi:formimidoylglutamate deiminase [Tardiphaga alba]|uniref:Formimidoylglutamate deiminase n=1 Tax=Tardiphaga alba TaxID=340268 RepID=A0ABX8A3C6_9BRAD|nr:formimidoylglutamate deiminase [Tardiphaga alba]QUS38101.1 formimidoylglutamate deiminase [Tardiphaga alba]
MQRTKAVHASSAAEKLFFAHALLPGGWARDVTLTVENGVIAAVADNSSSAGAEIVSGVALPGMPNLHSHAFQRGMAGLTELRGETQDSFWTWRQLMYRFIDTLTPDDVEAIAAYAYAEMLEGGFTSVAEFHYLHHDESGAPYGDLAELASRIASASVETGIGLTLLPVFYNFSGFGGAAPVHGQRRFINDPARFLALLERSREAIKPVADAAIGIAPHSLRAVTPETLNDVLNTVSTGPVHMHIAEQVKEVEDCLAWSGQRPVEWLLDHVDVNQHWVLIHATHLTPEETTGIAKAGAVVGLCPLTEANLGDGIFEGPRFIEAGGAFGVGTDSNIEITAPGELKQFEYSQRLHHRVRNAVARRSGESTGRALYEHALAGGAQASGRNIGALAIGKRADIVVLDDTHPDLCGVTGDRWLDATTFVAGKPAISSVYVGGKRVVESGRHLKRDGITERYRRVVKRLASL